MSILKTVLLYIFLVSLCYTQDTIPQEPLGACADGYRTFTWENIGASQLELLKEKYFSSWVFDGIELSVGFRSDLDKIPYSASVNGTLRNDGAECRAAFNFSDETLGLQEFVIPAGSDYNFEQTVENLSSLFVENSNVIVTSDCDLTNLTLVSIQLIINYEDDECSRNDSNLGECLGGYRAFTYENIDLAGLETLKEQYFSNWEDDGETLNITFKNDLEKVPYNLYVTGTLRNDGEECRASFNFSDETLGLKEFVIPASSDYQFNETVENLSMLFAENSTLAVTTDCDLTNLTLVYIKLMINFEDDSCENGTGSNNTNECLYGTYRFGGYCACWSGASGKTCTMEDAHPGTEEGLYPSKVPDAWSSSVRDISEMYYKLDFDKMSGKSFFRNFTGLPSCPLESWEKVYDLETGGVPVIDSFSLSNGTLNIVVSSPLVDGRADGVLFLNNDEVDKLSSDCYYPRSNYIEKSVSECRDTWTFALPWSSAKSCGWQLSSEETHFVYRGQIIVHYMEWLSIKQWRIVRSVLRLKIRFQKFVRVDCNTTIYNENVKSAAVTRQIVSIQLGQPALVELTTILNWPFKLSDGNLVKYPQDKISAVNLTSNDCVASEGQECVQNWRTLLQLTDVACTLDGDYSMNFSLGCGDDVASGDCPFDGTQETRVDYKLKSENFCAEMSVDVGIFGVMMCYSDDMFEMHKDIYIIGSKAYILIKINSDINPRNNDGQLDADSYDEETATIVFTQLSLKTVIFSVPGLDPVYLWDNYAPCPEDLDTGIALVSARSNGTLLLKNQIAFSFTWSRTLLTTLQQNGSLKVAIGAEIEVKYDDSSNTTKRMFFETSNIDRSTFSATSEVADDGKGPGNSSIALFISLIMFILALF